MKFSQACLLALALSASTIEAFAPSLFVGSNPLRTIVTQLHAEGTKITMPALSSTMKEGKVVSWLKSEGDAIEAGEAIMVVESDKADMDVEAFEDGFLAKIIVGEGEMAPVGEAVALIAESESDIDSVIASYGGGAAPVTSEVAAPVTEGMLYFQ
jgi:pyruvate dehydrogenase E2 component (dihydrolipoamide acetyltransferase)